MPFANVEIASVDDEFTAEGLHGGVDLAHVLDDLVAEFDIAQVGHGIGGDRVGHVEILGDDGPWVDYLARNGPPMADAHWVASSPVARNDGPGGPPDDPYYSDGEPTQYGSYPRSDPQAYSEPTYGRKPWGALTRTASNPDYGQQRPPPEPPTPWYRTPPGLVSLGALGVIILAVIVYAIVSLTGDDGSSSTSTTSSTSATSTPSSAGSVVPAPTGGTETVTQTEEPSTTTESPTTTTTTESPTTTTTTTTTTPTPTTSTTVSTSTSTSTSTVTQTVTVPPTEAPDDRAAVVSRGHAPSSLAART